MNRTCSNGLFGNRTCSNGLFGNRTYSNGLFRNHTYLNELFGIALVQMDFWGIALVQMDFLGIALVQMDLLSNVPIFVRMPFYENVYPYFRFRPEVFLFHQRLDGNGRLDFLCVYLLSGRFSSTMGTTILSVSVRLYVSAVSNLKINLKIYPIVDFEAF